MAKVIFENVTKRFGNFTAVENFNLEVNDHEFLCLVGPSGCGKTTTLRMLAGLDSITEGRIFIDDDLVNEIPPKDRGIAMVFQSYALYPHYNVYDNLAFGLRASANKSGKRLVLLFTLLLYALIISAIVLIGFILDIAWSGLGTIIMIAGIVSFLVTIAFYSDVRRALKNLVLKMTSGITDVREYIRNEQDIEDSVRNTAELLEIDRQLNKKPKQLSGGQRQRVALGRAIIRNPRVFLLDEPLSNLDAKLRVQMRGELQRLSQRLGVTSIYVTHDQVEAMTLGHRIAVLNEGILQQVGEPKELYLHPINKFVAGFIGSPAMNFLEGGIQEQDGILYFTSEILKYRIPERYSGLKEHINKDITLGIRPEHIKIISGDVAENQYGVTVGVVEPIGSDTFIHIDYTEDYHMIVNLEGMATYRVDDEVIATFDDEQIHFFMKDIEERILPDDELLEDPYAEESPD